MDKLLGIIEATGALVGVYGLGYPFERLCYYTMIKPYSAFMAQAIKWHEYNSAWDSVNKK